MITKKLLVDNWNKYHDKTGLNIHDKKAVAFKWFDSEILYTLIRILKPSKIVQLAST